MTVAMQLMPMFEPWRADIEAAVAAGAKDIRVYSVARFENLTRDRQDAAIRFAINLALCAPFLAEAARRRAGEMDRMAREWVP